MRDEAFADLGQQGIDGEDRRGHRARIRATRIRTWRGEAPNPHPALRASLSREQERGWNRAGTDYAHERASANSEDLRPHATAEPARAGIAESAPWMAHGPDSGHGWPAEGWSDPARAGGLSEATFRTASLQVMTTTANTAHGPAQPRAAMLPRPRRTRPASPGNCTTPAPTSPTTASPT